MRTTTENRRLLRSGKPKADESLMGYIIRLTEQNGYSSLSWIIFSTELTSKINRFCTFVCGPPERFERLASYTGTTISELASIGHDYYMFFGLPVPASSIRFGDPKVCPSCLSESLYCRRIWDLSAVTACPKHQCLLLDMCPSCNAPITWRRNHVSICQCEFDWREAEVKPIETSEIALTQRIHYLCGLPVDGSIFKLKYYRSPVTNLELGDLLLVLFFFAGLYKGVSISTGRHLLQTGRNSDLHGFLTNTYTVFEDWPNNLYQFLHWLNKREKTAPLIRNMLKSNLYREFGKFYTGLFRTLSGRQFDFIRDAFITFLVEEWGGGQLTINRNKPSEHPLTGRYVPKADAKRLLGADERRITHLIKTGKLKSEVRSKGMKRLIFVEINDIAKLAMSSAI